MRIDIRKTTVCCKGVFFLKFEDKLQFNFFDIGLCTLVVAHFINLYEFTLMETS